jgi:hypothetical protein
MDCRGVVPLGVVLIFALTSCAPPDTQTVWPEPRSLGKDLTSYRPPPLLDAAPPAWTVTNPTGVLTLSQAQALVLLQHPRLAAFGWEVRAGEARTLQASLPPNPSLGQDTLGNAGQSDRRQDDHSGRWRSV